MGTKTKRKVIAKCPLNPQQLMRVAVRISRDPRTVRRFLMGERGHDFVDSQIADALRAEGFGDLVGEAA